jgi:hypothetical protein
MSTIHGTGQCSLGAPPHPWSTQDQELVRGLVASVAAALLVAAGVVAVVGPLRALPLADPTATAPRIDGTAYYYRRPPVVLRTRTELMLITASGKLLDRVAEPAGVAGAPLIGYVS